MVANADRRYACWLGSANFSNLIDGRGAIEDAYVTRAEFEQDPATVHARCASLPGLSLEELAAQQGAEAAAEAQARADEHERSLLDAREATREAQRWWMQQAPAGSARERSRQRAAQGIVNELQSRWWQQVFMGSSSPPPPAPREQGSDAVPPRRDPPSLSPTSALAFAADALRLHGGIGPGDEVHLGRRLQHLRAAERATSAMNAGFDEDAIFALYHKQQQAGVLRAWIARARAIKQGRDELAEASRLGLLALQQRASTAWRTRVVERSAAKRLMQKLEHSACRVRLSEVGWRGFDAFMRWSVRCRRGKMLMCMAACRLLRGGLNRAVALWVSLARGRALSSQHQAAGERRMVARITLRFREAFIAAAARGRREKGMAEKGHTALLGSQWKWLRTRVGELHHNVEAARAADEWAAAQMRMRLWRGLVEMIARLGEEGWRGRLASAMGLRLSWKRMVAGVRECAAHWRMLTRVKQRSLQGWVARACEDKLMQIALVQAATHHVLMSRRRAVTMWWEYARKRSQIAHALRSHAPRHNLWKFSRAITLWLEERAFGRAKQTLEARVVGRRLTAATDEWQAAAEHCRLLQRVKLRLAARIRRGLAGSPENRMRRGLATFESWAKKIGQRNAVALAQAEAALMLSAHKLRRGLLAIAHVWLDELYRRRLSALEQKMLEERHLRKASAAMKHWKEEVAWRVERQNWVRCQVRYMHELQHMCDNGNGHRLARRLNNIGFQPYDGKSPEQNLTVIRRSSALYLKELERELQRVGGPGRLVVAPKREHAQARNTMSPQSSPGS